MFFAISSVKAEGILDSISDYTFKKLEQLHLKNKEYASLKQFDKIKYNLVLDETDWEIVFSNTNFHYYRGQPAQGFSMGSKTTDDFWDLMHEYNEKAKEGDDGVFIYSVVYFNFPMYFVQEKIKNFQSNGDEALFTQLEKIGAVKNDWYYQSKYLAANILKKCVLKSLTSGVFHDAVFCFSMTTSALVNNSGKGQCFMFNMAAPVGTKATEKYKDIEPSIASAIKSATGTGLTDYHYFIVKAAVQSARCAFQNNCSLDVSGFHSVSKSFYESNDLTTQGDDRIHLINATNLLQSMTPELAKACLEENNRLVGLSNASYATWYMNRPPGTVGGTEAFIQEYIKSIDKLYKKGCNLSRDEILDCGIFTCNQLKYTGIDLSSRICMLKSLMAASCPDQINAWTYATSIEYCEKIAINLITSVPPSQQEGFLTRIRDEGLLPELSNRLHNSTFSAFGENNYTAYIHALFEYCYNVYGSVLKNGSNISDLYVLKWSDRFFSSNDFIQTKQPGNRINLVHLQTNTLFPAPADFNSVHDYDPYDWVGVCAKQNSSLLGVAEGTTIWVPAIYLEWMYNQKQWSDIKVLSKTVLDGVSVLTGIGGVFRAASIYSKLWCSLELAVGTTDLALTNEDLRNGLSSALGEDGEWYLRQWDYFSLLVNATSLYKGITNFDEHAKEFRRIFGEKKVKIREQLPPADYDRMAKVDEELGKHMDELFLPSVIRQLVSRPSYRPDRIIFSRANKTSTFIGKWDEIVGGQQNGLQKVFNELSENDLNIYLLTGKLDHPGGFNMLSIDNFAAKQAEYVEKLNLNQINSSWTFDDYIWEAYNKPWLESALQRGDDIVIWSDPISSRTGFYKRELDFIQSNSSIYGYDYNAGVNIGIFSK